MNPYTAPERESIPDDMRNPSDVDDVAGHPHYDFILSKVLWGEAREEIYRSMAVNGITGSMADRLYEHARSERIKTIRSEYLRKLVIGIVLMLAAAGVFAVCWLGLGFIPRLLLYACFAAFGIGAWKTIDGSAGYIMAPNKEGSVADEI